MFIVCPRSCDKVLEKCEDDKKCSMLLENYRNNCTDVISWNGISTQPVCTEMCKRQIKEVLANPISRSLKCCMCNQTTRDHGMACSQRRVIESLCNITLGSSEECQKNNKECNDSRRRENNVPRRGRKL